ncbi:MAG: DNA alkylation repair protein, partial [Bacteroidaceae bacterium]|nr:DNA alkylation repair protein [Bacteroidaceae bacterium]
MIEHLLQPLVCERFKNDAKYREGHLRVVNALPQRRVLGLHLPEMKQKAKQLSRNGCKVILPNGSCKSCANGTELIRCFGTIPDKELCYEETLIWGFLINFEKCATDERLTMLEHYIPILDNWAVCDSYCANAKWMAKADKEQIWNFLQPYFRSTREFEVRFAIVATMTYLIDEEWLLQIFGQLEAI